MAYFPFGGTLDMEHINTTHHIPEATIKTKSVQKNKLKHTFTISDIHTLRKNTEIQLTPVDKLGQDQTSLSPSVTSILPVLHFRAESLCTHRALYGYLVSIPKTARSQVQTTQLHSRPTAHPHSTATHLIPNAHVFTWALCHTEQEHIT